MAITKKLKLYLFRKKRQIKNSKLFIILTEFDVGVRFFGRKFGFEYDELYYDNITYYHFHIGFMEITFEGIMHNIKWLEKNNFITAHELKRYYEKQKEEENSI